jgi:hypothetical protein
MRALFTYIEVAVAGLYSFRTAGTTQRSDPLTEPRHSRKVCQTCGKQGAAISGSTFILIDGGSDSGDLMDIR